MLNLNNETILPTIAMRRITVFGLSASRGSGAERHGDAGAKEAKAARNAKTRPPGREGAKANYRTVDK